MRQSRKSAADATAYKQLEIYRHSAKRKRSNDSIDETARSPGKDMQRDVTIHDHGDNEDMDKKQAPEDDDVELIGSHSQQRLECQPMEVSIQHIRQKMDSFTQQVSGLLDAGKVFFMDAATAFEQRIVHLHQSQMDKWEQEIELLRTMDAINEDMSFRLADARATISFVGPVAPIPAGSS